ncbi:MAG: hypothetical protein M3O35_11990 [Acidobacteriota bacterium]|nr:hypothetical protein [Acidobacteriota bacterium]
MLATLLPALLASLLPALLAALVPALLASLLAALLTALLTFPLIVTHYRILLYCSTWATSRINQAHRNLWMIEKLSLFHVASRAFVVCLNAMEPIQSEVPDKRES